MKEDQINQAISDYLLTVDTSYALMISGKWGCGKTFYWKKNISPETILKTKSVNDTEGVKYYKSIYISLYGVENIEEISKRIFLELIPKTGNSKASSIIKTIGGKMVSAASNFFSLGDLSLNIDEIKDIYDLKNCVITFDDLERIGGEIEQLDKVLGFINYLSEHDNIKVLLLTNEDELVARFEDKWSKTKEKIVNQTIPFSVNYDNIINGIVDSFKRFEDYHKFLKENSDLIFKAFDKSESNNLRTLKYSLERFLKLFDLFYKNNEQEFITTYGRNLLYYSMVISYELKKGHIDKNDEFEIATLSGDSISQMEMLEHLFKNNTQRNNQEKEKEKSKKEIYQEDFINRYYKGNEQIINLKLLFDFIITGLYDDLLVIALKENYLPKDNEVAPHQDVLNKLQHFIINGISQKELNSGIKSVLSYAISGEYHIMYYPIIYDFFLNLDKQKIYQGPSISKVKNLLIKGIEKANEKEINRTEIPFIEENWGEPPTQDYDIRIKFKALREKNTEKKNIIVAKDFLEKLENSPEKAVDIIFNTNGHTAINPLFKYLPIGRLTNAIIGLDNLYLIEFNHRIGNRFKYSSQTIHEEMDMLKKLLSHLIKYKDSRSTYDLKLYHIDFLIRNLTKITTPNTQ
jgi:hypothetical protein